MNVENEKKPHKTQNKSISNIKLREVPKQN